MAETTVGHIDDFRLDRSQCLVTETPPVEHSGGEVLCHRVGHADQIGQDLLASIGSQIQRNAALVCIVVVETTAQVDPAALIDESLGGQLSDILRSQRPWRTGSSMRMTSAPNEASHLVAPAPAS